jgi:hypothetical protein
MNNEVLEIIRKVNATAETVMFAHAHLTKFISNLRAVGLKDMSDSIVMQVLHLATAHEELRRIEDEFGPQAKEEDEVPVKKKKAPVEFICTGAKSCGILTCRHGRNHTKSAGCSIKCRNQACLKA